MRNKGYLGGELSYIAADENSPQFSIGPTAGLRLDERKSIGMTIIYSKVNEYGYYGKVETEVLTVKPFLRFEQEMEKRISLLSDIYYAKTFNLDDEKWNINELGIDLGFNYCLTESICMELIFGAISWNKISYDGNSLLDAIKLGFSAKSPIIGFKYLF
jgi:hypothetical protein